MSEEQARGPLLFVDDDPNILSTFRRRFGRRYDVHLASGGAEALALIDAGQTFSVIVSDMRMPGMNGIQLLAEIRRRAPESVRILLTGNADQETAVLAVNKGNVFRFLNKPVEPLVLDEAIEAALSRYRAAVSERRRLEQAEAIQHALEREQQASKLQREFIAMVSHEFRTPLAIIDSAIELLDGPYGLTEAQRRKRHLMIRDSVRRMRDLIDGVLNLSRLEDGAMKPQFSPVELHTLVAAAARQQEAACRSHRVLIDAEPINIIADANLINHIVTNLLSNAVKYSPGKTSIQVQVHQNKSWAVLDIVDQGIGIPAEECPRLFDKFFRASTASGIAGTGIGLHLVHSFVKLHGGAVAVTSTVGGGSCFTVKLPIADAQRA